MASFVNEHYNPKVMAFAITFLMMLCPFTAIIAGIDADSEQTFDLDMFVGDSFTYQPRTNLDDAIGGTITFSSQCIYSATSSGSFSEDTTFSFDSDSPTVGATFSGTPDKTGFFKCSITAIWTLHDSDANDTLTQTVTQYIDFEILDRIKFNGFSGDGDATQNIGLAKTAVQGTQIFETYIEKPADAGFVESSFTLDGQAFTSSSPFYYELSEGNLKVFVNDDLSEFADKEYVLKFPASYVKEGEGDDDLTDEAVITLKVNLGAVAITTDKVIAYIGETSAGETPGFKVVELEGTSPSTMTDVEWQLGEQTSVIGGQNALTLSEDGKLRVNTNLFTNDIIGANSNSKAYQFMAALSGKYTSGDETVIGIANKMVQFEIYKSLEFTTEPTFTTTVNAIPSSATNQDVLLETTIIGANKVSYSWGDGTGFTKDVSSASGSSVYTANHQYQQSGIYKIKVTAENDFGKKSLYILYDASTGTQMGVPDDDGEKSFFDEHGWQFILFAILAILMAIAWYFFGVQYLIVIILMAVFAILSILTFTFGDMPGMFDNLFGRV